MVELEIEVVIVSGLTLAGGKDVLRRGYGAQSCRTPGKWEMSLDLAAVSLQVAFSG